MAAEVSIRLHLDSWIASSPLRAVRFVEGEGEEGCSANPSLSSTMPSSVSSVATGGGGGGVAAGRFASLLSLSLLESELSSE